MLSQSCNKVSVIIKGVRKILVPLRSMLEMRQSLLVQLMWSSFILDSKKVSQKKSGEDDTIPNITPQNPLSLK